MLNVKLILNEGDIPNVAFKNRQRDKGSTMYRLKYTAVLELKQVV
jgi:hypothetical protein